MGLLDFNFEDPRNFGLLRAGAGIMAQAGDTSKPFGMGQALAYGMDTYANTLDADKKRKLDEQLAQQKIFETQENNIYARNLKQAQQEELQQKTAAMLAKQNTIKKIQEQLALNPDYKISSADMLLYDPDSFIKLQLPKEDRFFPSQIMEDPKTGELVTVQVSAGGKERVVPYKPAGKQIFVKGSGGQPDMTVNTLSATATPTQLSQQLSNNIDNNFPRLPSFGSTGGQSTVGGQSAFNIPLPFGLPTGLPNAQTMQEQPQRQQQGIFRTPPEKKISEKDELKYRTQIADDYKSLNEAISTTSEIKKSASELLNNQKGLSGITGLQSIFPDYPDSDSAKAAIALQDLKGKITKLGKAAATIGGAIGAISRDEWKIMSDMITAIDPLKGKTVFADSVKKVVDYAENTEKRIADAYKKQYEQDFQKYPQFSLSKSKDATATNSTKIMTMADVNATAKSRGISVQQVIDKARSAGYQIGGQ